jgi:glycerol kinase
VFLVKVILEEMDITLPAPKQLRISGGLSQLDGLCQRLASLAGVPVARADDPEATARGLAWLVHAEPQFAPQPTTCFEPRPDGSLAARFDRFRREMDRAAR